MVIRNPGCRFACPGLCAVALSGRIIGCGSAIQASLIAFALHDDSARPCKIRNLSKLILKTYLTSKLQIFIAKEEEGEEVEIGLRLKHYRPSRHHFVTLLHHFVTLLRHFVEQLLLSYHLL